MRSVVSERRRTRDDAGVIMPEIAGTAIPRRAADVCAASVPFADRPTRSPLRAKGARVAINQVGPAVRPVGTQDAAARRSGKRRQGGGDFPAREQNTILCDVARAATCEAYA